MRDTGVTHKLLFKVQNLAFCLIKPFSYLGLRRDKGHLLKERRRAGWEGEEERRRGGELERRRGGEEERRRG